MNNLEYNKRLRVHIEPVELENGMQVMVKAICRQNDLPEPVTEYRFHKRRRWRFDFAWPDQMLALEIDGGVYSRGRHTRGKGFEADCEKCNEATLLGWRVLRVTTGQMKRGVLPDLLRRALKE